MSLDVWLTYILATALILMMPGPTIILVISQAISHGRKSVIPLVAGVVFGDFTAMTLSLMGLGALMSTSATLFTIFKTVGALYLLYLGISMWRTNPTNSTTENENNGTTKGSLFKSSFIVTALNPKTIAFFVAFLPQFVDHRLPVLGQFLSLGVTFLTLAFVNAALYATFASEFRNAIQNPRILWIFNRLGGSTLIGAGIFTASMQRTQ